MTFGVLGRYIASRYLRTVLGVFGAMFALIFTVDLVETLRRSGESAGATAPMLAALAFLHTPIVAEQVLPFAVLLGAMVSFLNLSRRLELVVARAAGVSVWQFLTPALLVTIAIGVVEITAYNPLSTTLKRRAEAIEARMFRSNAATSSGVWLTQRSVDGMAIIHAQRAGSSSEFGHFQAFNFDPDGTFSQRVDAERARLRDGFWELQNATVVTPGFDAQMAGDYLLPTSLTEAEAAQAFAEPDTISFWGLSSLAEQVERAGLNAAPYRLRYQQLLALPATLAAMVLIASCFSLRMFRMGGVQKLVSGGVAAGFVLYVGTKVVGDFGEAGILSPAIAGWLPAVGGSLVGVFVLLTQEDG